MTKEKQFKDKLSVDVLADSIQKNAKKYTYNVFFLKTFCLES